MTARADDEVASIRASFGGTVNDVVLTIVTGALRRFLRGRRVALTGMDFRVVIPVDMRSGPVDLRVSNRVSAWFVSRRAPTTAISCFSPSLR